MQLTKKMEATINKIFNLISVTLQNIRTSFESTMRLIFNNVFCEDRIEQCSFHTQAQQLLPNESHTLGTLM